MDQYKNSFDNERKKNYPDLKLLKETLIKVYEDGKGKSLNLKKLSIHLLDISFNPK